MENKLWRLTIDTNPEDCNLHCIMCEEHSELSDFKKRLFEKTGVTRRVMPKEWIERIIQEAKTLGIKEIIPTTMGDPLVSDSFEYMAGLIGRNGIKMNVTHNGTFPGKGVEKWAEMIVPITSDIKISWNGAKAQTAESIMKGINHAKATENLKRFVAYRDKWFQATGHFCSVSLQLTFMRNNMHEIDEIIQFASELGIDRIKGHHLWVHHPEMEKYSFNTSNGAITEWNKLVKKATHAAETYRKKDGRVIKLENFVPIDKESKNTIPEHYECPFLEKELWISSTGKISPCCAPDELRDSLGDFGNISTQSLAETIKSPQYIELINDYKTFDLCKNCQMRKP